MNRLADMIARRQIDVEELAEAGELISLAEFVVKGVEACKKTLLFPFGVTEINCYSYMDRSGEYESWGTCSREGIFKCYCNWGGNHLIGSCNLTDFASVFLSFENDDFKFDLKNFLEMQIQNAGEA